MPLPSSEFIDTYSDDILFLIDDRRALLTHPLRRTFKPLCDASYSRLLAIVIVGSVEHVLELWSQSDSHDVLRQYFDERAANGERVEALRRAFEVAGIGVDPDVFSDYLAIKYLRNSIVHARRKDVETEWLQKRGFPTDPRQLTFAHWRKILQVHDSMLLYIAALLLRPADAPRISPHRESYEEKDIAHPIITRQDFASILWNNLENLSDALDDVLSLASLTVQSVAGSSSKDDWYRHLWEASRRDPELFSGHQLLVESALFTWNEYSRVQLEPSGLTDPTQIQALSAAIQEVIPLRVAGEFRWHPGLPQPARRQYLRHLLPGFQEPQLDRLLFALDLGEAAYSAVRNVAPCWLFGARLPILAPQRIPEFAPAASLATAILELNRCWYHLVELGTVPDLAFVERIRRVISEFADAAQ